MDKPIYSWSQDEEIWHGPFGSIDEAIKDAFDTCAQDVTEVSIGETEVIDTGALLTADQFCDLAQERLSDEIGESGDDFLSGATVEQRAELDALLAAWVAKVEPGPYYRVDGWKAHRFADYRLSREAE
ncbi:hypothetical protein [Stenotrophomonas maltophilia]|uniref:hypothetical protein n=1 Tax=Stenotrophomonas maltophilia TaxID=40324 RepID=UPI003D7CC81F